MYNLKNNTNESVYRTEIKSGIENNLWLSKEKGKWEKEKLRGWVNIYTLLYKIDKQKGFTVQ